MNNFCVGDQFSVTERAKEIDLQFDRGERFTLLEATGPRRAHGRIGHVAQHSAMQGPHGIGVLWTGLKFHGGPVGFEQRDPESDQSRNWGRRTAPCPLIEDRAQNPS